MIGDKKTNKNNKKKRLPPNFFDQWSICMYRECSIDDNNKKSEVLEMRVSHIGEEILKVVSVICLIFGATSALYAAGLDSVDQSSIIEKIGTIIKNIGAIVAFGSLGYALILGALKWNEDQAEAIQHIKGGVIGAFLGGASWGISKWLIGMLQ